jgi:phenylpropionate dioxygenase-like ring-hydroxylating dioxygenase large terminal subunit
MHHREQIVQARKLLAFLATRTTALADGVLRRAIDGYVAPEQAAREQRVLFHGGPMIVGLSCLLPEPGDYLTHDHAGVPVLLVRRSDGSLGAFLNV